MLSPNWRSFVANVDRLVANVTFAKTAVAKLVVAKKVVAKLTGHRCRVDDLAFVDCETDLGQVLLPVERRKLTAKIAARSQQQATGGISQLLTFLVPKGHISIINLSILC